MEPLSSNGLATNMTRSIRRVFAFSLILIMAALFVVGLQFYLFVKTPLPLSGANATFEIVPGTSTRGIAHKLYTEGFITHPRLFLILIKCSHAWGKLKAGEYNVKPGTTPSVLVQQLVDGKIVQHSLTLIEGWTFERIMQEINQSPKLTHTLIGLPYQEVMEKLGYKDMHPEGRFFPETYYYTKGTTDVILLRRALLAMEGKLLALWYNRSNDLPFKTPYEALILASIIERESSTLEEYAEISGVYIRRLQKDMLLQADPTVIYGLGKHYKPPLTIDMLRAPSPYNTYLNKGLPPTPIALPSIRALNAALHPEPGESLFFVAKPNGKGHIFAKDYEEHKENIKLYKDGRENKNP